MEAEQLNLLLSVAFDTIFQAALISYGNVLPSVQTLKYNHETEAETLI